MKESHRKNVFGMHKVRNSFERINWFFSILTKRFAFYGKISCKTWKPNSMNVQRLVFENVKTLRFDMKSVAMSLYRMQTMLFTALSVGYRIRWLCHRRWSKTTPQGKDIFGMTLICVWCWGSNSGDLRSPKNMGVIAMTINPMLTLIWRGSTCLNLINISNRYVEKLWVHMYVVSNHVFTILQKKCEGKVFFDFH